MRNKKGFTLLELIIVVIVIGILAAIALPRYFLVAEKGRVSEAKAILGAMRDAQMRYAVQYSTYAGSPASLDFTITASRFFAYSSVAASGTALGNDGQVVAYAIRNTVEAPQGTYNVSITAGGTIVSTNPVVI